MKVRPPVLNAFSWLLAVVVFSSGLALAEKPIAVVGNAEGKSVMRSVVDAGLVEASVERFEEGLPASDFAGYGMVILSPEGVTPYGPEECRLIFDYVSGGGRLLLIQQAPKLLRIQDGESDREGDYLFGRSFYHREGLDCDVLMPGDALVKGVIPQGHAPHWLNAQVTLKNPEFEAVIGGGGQVLAGRLRVGQGVVYYLGHELFRMQLPSRPERHADAESWIALMANMIEEKL